jgi:hypothetical protein
MKRNPTYPHFLCIGAQKSGTTWLHRNLREHPEVCLANKKELDYFVTRNLGLWTLCRRPLWRYDLRRKLLSRIFSQSPAQTAWYLRYFFLRRTDAWYASLFRSCGDRVIGDVSPSYSILDAEEVEHVARIMPAARIILLLRNPVERAWSHARMDCGRGWWPCADYRGRPIDEVPFDVLRQHLDNPFSTLRGDYLRMLRNWESHFPTEQIFIGFAEEIEEFPALLLERIAAFLGISPNPVNGWPQAGERVGAQEPMEIPAQVERYLSRKYVFDLKDLEKNTLVGDSEYVKNWRQNAERHLE